MTDPWLVKPYETEPCILNWSQQFDSLVQLDVRRQWCGLNVYAVTVTDRSVRNCDKPSVLIAVPHAHEPAGTAGCMQAIQELLTGKGLDDVATSLDRERVLRELMLCFIPDANPDGRNRSPVRFWDGHWCDSTERGIWMRGRDATTKQMWQRLGRWSRREHEPETIGIVYEQISAHEYVEPNRDAASSYCALFRLLDERHGLDRVLEVHQTEFEGMTENATVLLPIEQADLPPAIAEENLAWGRAVHAAWRDAGGDPTPDPYPLNYGPDQGDYFRNLWGPHYRRRPWINTEVQNDTPKTPPEMQVHLCAAAVRATIERMLSQRNVTAHTTDRTSC
jgi:hypothetical protein